MNNSWQTGIYNDPIVGDCSNNWTTELFFLRTPFLILHICYGSVTEAQQYSIDRNKDPCLHKTPLDSSFVAYAVN